MRFGTFVFPISVDPEKDCQVIHNTLREVELAEEIGMHSVWLAEHHFAGAVAYSDPVVFGAAVAMRTKRVRIGFAVLELPMWHPIRLAVQTSLLDNLSHGRLMVGTGPGPLRYEYEFLGFGVGARDCRPMMDEGEDLLVKAWAGENVRHDGRFWKASFPQLRPTPYQKPHPPLYRACVSDSSVRQMAKLGRPVLLGVTTRDAIKERLSLYRDTMLEAGFGEEQVERTLDQTWGTQRHLYLTDSEDEAQEVAALSLQRLFDLVDKAETEFNPPGLSLPPRDPKKIPAFMPEYAYLAGQPKRLAEQIAELRDLGVRNLLLKVNTGDMPMEQVERSMRLFGDKVMPLFSSD